MLSIIEVSAKQRGSRKLQSNYLVYDPMIMMIDEINDV